MREFYRQREAQMTLVPVDVNRLIEQVIDLTRARWSDRTHQRGVVIDGQIALAPALPSIMGAESEIREALTNLVFNAIDAMSQGGTLTLRTQSTSRSVSLEIVDTGIGMDEDTQRRCLEIEGDVPAHVDQVLSKPPKLRELREALLALAADAARPRASL